MMKKLILMSLNILVFVSLILVSADLNDYKALNDKLNIGLIPDTKIALDDLSNQMLKAGILNPNCITKIRISNEIAGKFPKGIPNRTQNDVIFLVSFRMNTTISTWINPQPEPPGGSSKGGKNINLSQQKLAIIGGRNVEISVINSLNDKVKQILASTRADILKEEKNL
jgi:hypothetical protein